MNNVKDTSLTGVAILLLSGAMPLLEAGQVLEAALAILAGFGALALKYFLRDRV